MVAAFDERRKVIVDELNAMPGFRCVEPSGAFYAFPNITGTGLRRAQLEAKLLDEAGVATIAGTSFGAYGEGYPALLLRQRAREHPRGDASASAPAWRPRRARPESPEIGYA